MLLIWGTKKVERKLGFVGETCPRCRAVRSVKVSRIGLASHLFFVPVSRGRLLGFLGECQQCSGEFEVQPTDYSGFEKNKKAELNSLVTKTNPKLLPGNKHAVELFNRFFQLRDPFLRFNQSLVQRYARGTRFDLPSGLALLATFVVPIALGFAIPSMPFSDAVKGGMGKFAIGLFLVGLIGSVVLLFGEQKRFFRKRLLSEITSSLKALNPQEAELDSVVAALRKYGYHICRFVSTESLLKGTRGY